MNRRPPAPRPSSVRPWESVSEWSRFPGGDGASLGRWRDLKAPMDVAPNGRASGRRRKRLTLSGQAREGASEQAAIHADPDPTLACLLCIWVGKGRGLPSSPSPCSAIRRLFLLARHVLRAASFLALMTVPWEIPTVGGKCNWNPARANAAHCYRSVACLRKSFALAKQAQRSGEGLFAIAFYSSFLLKTEAKMTRATSASASAYKWESKMSFVSRSLCGISHNKGDFRKFSKRATLSSSNQPVDTELEQARHDSQTCDSVQIERIVHKCEVTVLSPIITYKILGML